MKTTLSLLFLLFVGASHAQTTHIVNWFMGVSTNETTISIAQGDSVTWQWSDDLPHTVSSLAGSVESFESGTISGIGATFTREFTAIGDSQYRCNFHPMMNGVITVQPLGIEDHARRVFTSYPNPVTDVFTISGAEKLENITVINEAGRIVLTVKANTPDAKIYMGNYPSGIYFVKVQAGGSTSTIQVLKK